MKSMKSLSLVVFAALAAVVFAQPAQAMVNVSAVGSFNITTTHLDPSNPLLITSAGNGFGGGALVSFGLMPAFELETGALYTPFVSHFGAAPIEANLTQKYIVIPVVARFTLLPIISVGAGISYGVKSGDLTSDNSAFPFTGTAKNNLSLTGSVALRLPLAPMFGFLVDARYNLGLTDQSGTAGTTQKFNQIQILAGLNFKL